MQWCALWTTQAGRRLIHKVYYNPGSERAVEVARQAEVGWGPGGHWTRHGSDIDGR